MKSRKVKRLMAIILAGTLISTLGFTSVTSGEEKLLEKSRVSVHDPSIVKEDDTYYVFGSHIEAAKSTDLQNWTTFTNGYTTPGNVIFGDLSDNLEESFEWAGEDDSDCKGGYAVWAPDRKSVV